MTGNDAAFESLFMGLFSLIALVCSLRTNLAFVLAFTGLVITFPSYAAANWYLAAGEAAKAHTYQLVSTKHAVGDPQTQ